jgi:hypothetical protein
MDLCDKMITSNGKKTVNNTSGTFFEINQNFLDILTPMLTHFEKKKSLERIE